MALSNSAADIRVYINGVENTSLKPLVIERFAGGKRLDRATLELYAANQAWQHPSGFAIRNQQFQGAECRIVHWAGVAPTCIHYGFIHSSEMEIGPGENRVFTSALKSFHFVPRWNGMKTFNPLTGRDEVDDHDIIFNPRIDGRVLGNKRPNANRFLQPDSTRTTAAQQYNGGPPQAWQLFEAIGYLCESGNDETHVLNPTVAAMQAIGANDVLRDITVPFVAELPEALDRVLEPFGYSWFLDLSNPFGKPRIQIFRRGVAVQAVVGGPTQTSIHLDQPGSHVASAIDTEVYEFRVDYDSSEATNLVVVYGAFERIEDTFELMPAWAATDDTLPMEDLAQHSDREATLPETARVWREWVLNEAGDYNGMRPGKNEPYKFEPTLGVAKFSIPRRRRFLPTLTLRPDGTAPAGQHDGVHVEVTTDGGATWKPIEEINESIELLRHECGIRFSGTLPPATMYYAGNYPAVRVRVTATVELDDRLRSIKDESGTSVLASKRFTFIDMSDSFQFSEIKASSELGKKITGVAGGLKSGAQDDRTAFDAVAAKLVEAWNIAGMSAAVAIDGIPARGSGLIFQVGDVIKALSGRGITFQLHPTRQKYPQVVAVQYLVQQQAQRLYLESIKNTPQLDLPDGLDQQPEPPGVGAMQEFASRQAGG